MKIIGKLILLNSQGLVFLLCCTNDMECVPPVATFVHDVFLECLGEGGVLIYSCESDGFMISCITENTDFPIQIIVYK